MYDRIPLLKEMLIDKPNDPFVHHALALEYIKINNLSEAKKLLIHSLNHNPNYLGSYYHLAKVLISLNETQLAQQYFSKGLELAKKINDLHSYNELKSALEELQY